MTRMLRNNKGRITTFLGDRFLGLPIWIWLVLLLAGAIAGGFVNVDKIRNQSQVFSVSGLGGGLVTSLDQVKFISDDPDVPSHMAWQGNVVLGVANDKLVGELPVDKDILYDPSTGTKAANGFKIDFVFNQERLVYSITQEQDSRVDTVNYYVSGTIKSLSSLNPFADPEKICRDYAESNNYIGDHLYVQWAAVRAVFSPHCEYNVYEPIAYTGLLGLKGVTFDADVIFTNADGEPATVTIGVPEGSSVDEKKPVSYSAPIVTSKGKKVGSVLWYGNLLSNAWPPELALKDYKAAYVSTEAAWIPVTSSGVQRYVTSGVQRPLGGFDSGLKFITQASVDSYNKGVLDSLRTQPVFVPVGGVGQSSEGDEDSGVIFVSMDTAVIRPQLLVKLDAEWVGIERASGKPELSGFESKCFPTGPREGGKIFFKIKNKGQDDTFTITAQCNSPITATPDSFTIPVSAGEERTAYVALNGETAKDQEEASCIINAVSSNGESFSELGGSACVAGIEPQICGANAYSCNGDFIVKCNEYGTGVEVTKDCGVNKKTCSLATVECVDKADGGKKDGGSWFDNILAWLRGLFPWLGTAGLRTLAFLLIVAGIGIIVLIAVKGSFGLEALIVLLGAFVAYIMTQSLTAAIAVAIVLFVLFWILKGGFKVFEKTKSQPLILRKGERIVEYDPFKEKDKK